MNDRTDEFAAWLNRAMLSHGLSQAELARKVGVADTQVSRWRRGQVLPSLRYLQQLADTFGVPRVNLDRLAGYPTPQVPDEANVDTAELGRQTELTVYQARYRQILEEKVPQAFWPVYAEACEALADALSTSFHVALSKVHEEAVSSQKAVRPLGFRHHEGHHQADES